MRVLSLVSSGAEILTRGLRSRLLRASGLVLAANVLGEAMNFVAVILTIRHLSPEAFGILTVALTTMQFVAVLSNAGLNETLMTLVSRAEAAHQSEEVAQSLAAILRVRNFVLMAVAVSGVLLTRPIADYLFRQPDLAFPLALGVLGACGVSLCQFSLWALRALRAYAHHAALVLIRSTALLGTLALLAGVGRLDMTTALVANVVAPFLAFAVSLVFAPLKISRRGSNQHALFRRIWDLSKWVAVLNLCSAFLSRFEIYLLAAFVSPVEMGLYSAAFRLSSGILFLQEAIRIVLFPEVSRRAGAPGLATFVRRSLWPLIIFGGILWGLGILAALFIPPLLGERYAASVPIFLILLPTRIALIPLAPLSLLFFATDRTRAGALFGAVQLAVLGGAGLALVSSYGALGMAWAKVLVTVAAAVYLVVFAWPYLWSPSRPLGQPASSK